MKNRVAPLFLATAILSAPTGVALASPDQYFGAQFSMLNYDEVGISEISPTALILRGGVFLADNLALETRFGIGLGDDSTTYQGIDVAVELDTLFGAYMVGYLPVSDAGSLYGVLGFTSAKVTATASYMGSSASESGSDSGLSFGVGGQYSITPQVSLTGEYMRYLDGDGYDLTGLNLGINYRF